MVQQQEDKTSTDKEDKKQVGSKYFYAHGRRKEAAARVRLYKGRGQFIVNNRPIEKYFAQEVEKSYYLRPFLLTKTQDKYYATVKVEGSGKSGQLAAVVHGLARALVKTDESFRPILKKAGLLTRDSRVKERRKYGLAQKARKGKQSPRR
ncbi:30S ribosomal protein S9 [Candidatus Curtissbacteria bacterium RIFCSPLOWO2_01_FULL_41_18]|uniref:Small ribosomal subunit protein uS9 n=1 Tax=Candidatus Curtissbacteria bacterium RIFCSPLOWO2_01_FULL_41_18 TaxID=1797727 RepID=A0A1F5HLS3_9BACT|nr:MAG: 30S ribosomal protein S9 [Candidatus Curtissbacteria bacterium RIFCSPLOWO2_01_FULL_41_18]